MARSNKLTQSSQSFDNPFDMPVADNSVTVTTTTTVSSNNQLNRKALADSLKHKYFDSEVLTKALQQIPHKKVSQSGRPLIINNIFFLLKMSDDYGTIIAKAYPYHAFTNNKGVTIPAKPADHLLTDITKEILTAEGIDVTDEYLNTQLQRLNAQYGF